MSFRLLVLLMIGVLAGCVQAESEQIEQQDQQQPNIVYILTDDLGYGDLGTIFQNSRADEGKPRHKTPQLDRMAREGMLLTRHYASAPVCAPARASLLQGVHQGHANVRNNQFDKALSDNHNLASVLKEAGYATGIVGKWGLQGRDGDSPETWEAYPTKRGFDHFFGYVRHRDGHNHYPAHEAAARPEMELYSGTEEISTQLKGAYTTDLFTAAAKKWIIDQEQNHPDQPFFLYLAYDTPHAGLQVAPSAYPGGGGLHGGVQWIGEQDNYINTVDGSIDDHIHPDYANRDWASPQKRFASMVRRIDDGVGDILQLLKDLNIDENTIVVFTSDNGPHSESYGYGDYAPNFFDSFGPLDGIKRDTWEGGIRMPTIVRWPGQVPAGMSNDAPSGFHDWMATFAEIANVPAPARTDGVSLLPALTEKDTQDSSVVYIEYSEERRTPDYSEFHPSHRGQRRGEMQVIYLDGYKGVRYGIQSAGDDFRIYDTLTDPGETEDLAGSAESFVRLQQRMKDAVLRVRRPDSTAVRPYDEVPMPALSPPENEESGLTYSVYEVVTPWTPDVATLRQDPVSEGVSSAFDLSVQGQRDNIVVTYSGLLNVPETGAYTFSLQTDGAAVLRIHDATVIDADRGYSSGSVVASEVRLEEGYHPVSLVYARRMNESPSLEAQWSGPGFGLKTVEPERLSH